MSSFYSDLKHFLHKIKLLIILIGGIVFIWLFMPIYKTYESYQFSIYIIEAVYGTAFLTAYNLYWIILLSVSIFTRWIGLALLFISVSVNFHIVQSLVNPHL